MMVTGGKVKKLVFALIVLVSVVMHFPHMNKDLVSVHVWRQTQTQSTIDSYFEEDFNILNPRRNERGNGDGIFRMEFGLMQWLIAGLYKIFGQKIIITRIFMFITGLFAVWGMYRLVSLLFRSKEAGLLAAWTFNFSPCFFYYTINPLPDVFALATGIWGMALFVKWTRDNKTSGLWFSGLLLAVSTLCKLPFVLFYAFPAGYFLWMIVREGVTWKRISEGLQVAALIVLPAAWYISVIPGWTGNGIVQGMMDNKTGTSLLFSYLKHNLVSTLPELLLNYGAVPFFIAGFYFLVKNKAYKNTWFMPLLLLSAGVLAYFFFEINMIAKVHDYYLFPFYPLLFVLVAYGAKNWLEKGKSLRYITFCLLLILPVTAFIRNYTRWDTVSPGFNADLLKYKSELRAAVPDNALCVVGNDDSHFIFMYYVHKKGWGFDKDNLDGEMLSTMISEGAAYLYSDSRLVENDPLISAHLGPLHAQFGSIYIYPLK